MSHIASDYQSEELAAKLSRVPQLLGNLVEIFRSSGASIPAQILDFLLSTAAESESASIERWEFLHTEYLREVFGAFGDTSKIVSKSSLLDASGAGLVYESPSFESRRESLRQAISRGAFQSLPRSDLVFDPYLAAHWKIVQSEDRSLSGKYQDFLRSLTSLKLDISHQNFVHSLDLDEAANARTSIDLRKVLQNWVRYGSIEFDKTRSSRNCLVLSAKVSQSFTLVLVIDEISVFKANEVLQFRPFIRLVISQATGMAGAAASGIIMQVPINDLVPGAYIYGLISSSQELAVGLAFYLRLFENLAPAFFASLNN